MSRALRELERIDSRALAALRCLDAGTGAEVDTPLTLEALDGRARFVRNRSGLYVLTFWSALADHASAFGAPPEEPEPGTIELSIAISDPSGRYLARRVTLALPRDPDPENAAQASSLFLPLAVPMYPAPAAGTGANWSVLRVSVIDEASGDALGGALLRARRNGDVLGRGLTDGRGEGLLALVGVPLLTFGEEEEAVVVDEITITVEALFDPAAGTRMTAEALRAGVRPPVPAVDPDAIEANAAALPLQALEAAVAARRSHTISIALDLP